MVKLLLVYPNAVLQNPPPVALALFTGALRGEPVELRLFDTTLYDLEEKTSDQTKEQNLQVRPFDFGERQVALKATDPFADFRAAVEDFAPDLIALSANEVTFPLGLSLLEDARELPEFRRALKLAGGVFPTCAPDLVLCHPVIDAVCVGEGEAVMVEVIRALAAGRALDGIAGLQVKNRATGAVRSTPPRAPLALDALPLPDYSLFAAERFYRPMAGRVWRLLPVETSRGCPYACTFCNSPTMARLYRDGGGHRFFRKKSVARIDRELADLVGRYGAEYIYFLSDTLLALSDPEFDAFCRMYEKYRLPFWCQNRPEMITAPRARRLKEIGCHRMSVGIEHGNEEFRRRVLKKNVGNDRIVAAAEILAGAGIPVSLNNIIGFPGETRELAMDTVRLNRRLPHDTVNAYAFTPFHGTDLHALAVREGYLEPAAALTCMTKGTVLRMPQFPREEINGLVKTFALYARLPEADFPRIRIAERDDEAGRQAFAELSERYRRLYFSGGTADPGTGQGARQ